MVVEHGEITALREQGPGYPLQLPAEIRKEPLQLEFREEGVFLLP